jgi:hypothetical protein
VQDLTERQRERWFESYVETLIARDIAEVAEVRDGHSLGQLVRLLAAYSGQELVQKTLADGIGVRPQTVANWLAWLEAIFMVFRLPAWSPNATRRVIRRPKVHFADTGLCAHLLGRTGPRLAEPTESLGGALLESFVAGELQRQLGWSETRVRLFHLREHRGPEIDLIAEAADGRIVAFEVKATRSRPGSGGEPLVALRERLKAQPGRFVHGFVLYTGEQAFRLDEGITALPIEALWRCN